MENGLDKYLYSTWYNMRNRCLNPKHEDYRHYGGRGIEIYEPWINSFDQFREYILRDLGPRPDDHWLDRTDNDGHYEPGNLRWATPREQNNNTSWNLPIEDRHVYKFRDRWRVSRSIDGRMRYFGTFRTIEEARVARDKSFETYPI